MTLITRSYALGVERSRGPFAPYAPIRAVERVLLADRDRALAEPITVRTLEAAGVSKSMCPRTLQALRFLGLVDGGGYRTEAFEALRAADQGELAAVLAGVLRRAYPDLALGANPPTKARIDQAFRLYEPRSQHERMKALFRGLAVKAGILPEGRADRGTSAPEPGAPRRRSLREPMLNALLERLPANGRWTEDERDRWLRAWAAAVDLMVKVQG